MEATYYKDTLHTYMIIACPPEAETTGYQYRMLEMNRIDGLVPCGLRHIDGEGFLYYETTGKQSLESLYEGRKIPGSEVFRLLEAINRVTGALSNYLLDEQQLVLTQEQIFYDFSSGQYFFTYYPGDKQSMKVFRFLAEGIDSSDKEAAAAAYRLCAAVEEGRRTIREAVKEEMLRRDTPRAWERGLEEKESTEQEAEFAENETTEFSSGIRGAVPEEEEGRDPEKRPFSGKLHRPKREETGRKKGERSQASDNLHPLLRILLVFLLLAGAGGLFAVQLFVYIPQRERRLCIAGTILLLLCACLMIAEMILALRRRKRMDADEARSREPSYLESDEKDIPIMRTGTAQEYRLSGEDSANTVCFSEQSMTGRLYGRERGNRIDLRTLPVTIGKAQAYADVILPDPSVSRVHARVYKGEEGCIEVRDLGSTNGTFINGTRLGPNEKKRVQRGDEVRFGNVEYEYR